MPTIKTVVPKLPPRERTATTGTAGDEPVYDTQKWEDFHSYLDTSVIHGTNIPGGVLVQVDTNTYGGMDPRKRILNAFTAVPFEEREESGTELSKLLGTEFELKSSECNLSVSYRCTFPAAQAGIPVADDWSTATNLLYYDSVSNLLHFDPTVEIVPMEQTIMFFFYHSRFNPNPATLPVMNQYRGTLVPVDFSRVFEIERKEHVLETVEWIFEKVILPLLDHIRRINHILQISQDDLSRYVLNYIVIPTGLEPCISLLTIYLTIYCTTFLNHPNRSVEDRVVPSALRVLFAVSVTSYHFNKFIKHHQSTGFCMDQHRLKGVLNNRIINAITNLLRNTPDKYFNDPTLHEGRPPVKLNKRNKNQFDTILLTKKLRKDDSFPILEEYERVESLNLAKCYTCEKVDPPVLLGLSDQPETSQTIVHFELINDNVLLNDSRYFVDTTQMRNITVMAQAASLLQQQQNLKRIRLMDEQEQHVRDRYTGTNGTVMKQAILSATKRQKV